MLKPCEIAAENASFNELTKNHWAAQTAFLTDLDVRTIHGTHLRLGHGEQGLEILRISCGATMLQPLLWYN